MGWGMFITLIFGILGCLGKSLCRLWWWLTKTFCLQFATSSNALFGGPFKQIITFVWLSYRFESRIRRWLFKGWLLLVTSDGQGKSIRNEKDSLWKIDCDRVYLKNDKIFRISRNLFNGSAYLVNRCRCVWCRTSPVRNRPQVFPRFSNNQV